MDSPNLKSERKQAVSLLIQNFIVQNYNIYITVLGYILLNLPKTIPMKKSTRKLIGRIFTVTTVAQVAFYSYVYLIKGKKSEKVARTVKEKVSKLEDLV